MSPSASSSCLEFIDPPFAPIRITVLFCLAASTIDSMPFFDPMFPGFILIAGHPESIAAIASRGSKWISAINGSLEKLATVARFLSSSILGKATLASSQPAFSRFSSCSRHDIVSSKGTLSILSTLTG